MLEPRRLEDVQREIYRQLALNGSYLTDATPGSVLYSLTRAFAAAALNGDQLLYEAAQGYFINTAKDKQLDEKAGEFGVFRRGATRAGGHILVRSRESDLRLRPQAVFVEPVTGVQLLVNLTEPIVLPQEVEVKVPVVAARPGKAGNLSPGTRLVYVSEDTNSQTQPELAVEAYVGAARTLQGEIIGGLTGGEDAESDAKLRQRLLRHIQNRNSCTEEAILTLVFSDNRVHWATTHSPFAGHTQVWIETHVTDTTAVLNDLTQLLQSARPLGTTLSVHTISTRAVEFEVHYQSQTNTDFNQLNERVETTIWDYCYRLPYGKPLRRSDLAYQLRQIKEARFLALLKPTEDITPPPMTALRPGNINIRHDVY